MGKRDYELGEAGILVEDVKKYGGAWTEDLEPGDVSEDEDFLYLEVIDPGEISEEFHELGTELSAHTSEVNNGERYLLAVEKQYYFSRAF